MIQQYHISLPPHPRGFHLITSEVLRQISSLPKQGILHLFIQHTSAGLSVNENADPSVRHDFEQIFNHMVPENQSYYTHIFEGADDMPAHVKSSLVGASVTLPVTEGRLNLGTWQGIYLCEFRNRGGRRKLVATVYS
ncbi:MAG: secondary thiamine-phosphate synthase enzyme YjbQ [Bacteroidota bacterium]